MKISDHNGLPQKEPSYLYSLLSKYFYSHNLLVHVLLLAIWVCGHETANISHGVAPWQDDNKPSIVELLSHWLSKIKFIMDYLQDFDIHLNVNILTPQEVFRSCSKNIHISHQSCIMWGFIKFVIILFFIMFKSVEFSLFKSSISYLELFDHICLVSVPSFHNIL